jgi:hypothetical protein
MTRRFRLAGVLRARLAQERAAKATVARAYADEAAAEQRRARLDRALTDAPMAGRRTASWYVATLSARQAMAAEASDAGRLVAAAAEVVQARTADLTGAAIRRRTIETLAERHATAARQAEDRAEQQAVDELAAARPGPAGPMPGGGQR